MPTSLLRPAFLALVALTACGGRGGALSSASEDDGAPSGALSPAGSVTLPLVVPHFAADDPRVGTAGFVSQTTRMNEDVDGTTYTLMIFAVGDTLTLGAMIRGEFEGTAGWVVGERSFSVPLRRADRGGTEVTVTGAPLVGQHGGFDAFDWVNVEVPLEDWIRDGTRVRLVFHGDGVAVELPRTDGWFAARLESR